PSDPIVANLALENNTPGANQGRTPGVSHRYSRVTRQDLFFPYCKSASNSSVTSSPFSTSLCSVMSSTYSLLLTPDSCSTSRKSTVMVSPGTYFSESMPS